MDEERREDSHIRIPTATMDTPSNLSFPSEDFPTNQYGSKRDSIRIRKSSSLDSNSVLMDRKSRPRNVLFSSDSDTEAEFTTKTAILNSSNVSTRPLYASAQHCKTPSMPSIAPPRTVSSNNLESVDFFVKGMRMQNGFSSTPSIRDLVVPRCVSNRNGQDPSESVIVARSEKPRLLLGALSAVDLQHQHNSDCDDIELKHVLPFVKEAAPGVFGHYPVIEPEPLLEKKPGIHRMMIFQDFYRFVCPEKIINRITYDLDELILGERNMFPQEPITSCFVISPKKASPSGSQSSNSITNMNDEFSKQPCLHFESRFESGNLRKAIQIRQYEYDLLLNSDINSDHHCQWFYFEVSNMEPDVYYRFNIINCEKFNSQFNFGMQPVFYSTKDAEDGQPGWERTGSNVCYYKNFYQRKADGQCANKYYFTTTFTIKFPYADDVCFLAYHYPYTFSMMKAHISKLEGRLAANIYYDNQILCFTSHGNECDVITITEKPNKDDPQSVLAFRKRPYVVLTSRVHPGESCSSWVIKGALDFLTSDSEISVRLRETFIFKIVPFLNPDGVINGNHRCSISGDDLNRQWISPDPTNHPTIYHIKGFIQYLNSIKKPPLVYCDFHGHSRRKNVFMYGCSLAATTASREQGNSDTVFFSLINPREGEARVEISTTDDVSCGAEEDIGYKALPRILNAIAPAFSIQSCSFIMERSKEATARIVVFKELGVLRSYTLESTYCGADQGPYKGNQFGTRELEEMGKDFCVGLLKLSQSYSVKLKPEYFHEPRFADLEKDEETFGSETPTDAVADEFRLENGDEKD